MASAKKELISGVFFTAIARYAGIAVTLAVTAILARLMSGVPTFSALTCLKCVYSNE